MGMRPKVPTKQHGRVARDGIACVSYRRAAVVSRLQEIGGQSKSEGALFTHTGYQDKLPEHLLAHAGIPIN